MAIRVLYVEDDPDDFELMRGKLQSRADRPFELSRAESITVAQRMVCLERFDIILVDYLLSPDHSDANGLDLVRWLHDAGARMPMILVSSGDRIDLRGFEDLLEKGVEIIPKQELLIRDVWQSLLRSLEYPLQLLMVDDHPEDRLQMREYLQAHPYLKFEISEASKVETARQMLAARPYDLLLCDYLLGAYSSIPFLEQVLEQYPDISVVLVTGHLNIQDDRSALRLIGRRKVVYLSKMIMDADSLVQAIKRSRGKLVDQQALDTVLRYV